MSDKAVLVKECEYKHDVVDEQLAKISKVLNGNGQGGLVRQVTRIEEQMLNAEHELAKGNATFESINKRLTTIMYIVVVMAVVSGGSLVERLLAAIVAKL